jgi:Icc-related predicted phosphoesterase
VPVYQWLVELDEVGNIITDGRTRLLGNTIVSSIPHYWSFDQKKICLDRGTSLKKSHPEHSWIVLYYVPPAIRDLATAEEVEALTVLKSYRPDFFVCGHGHDLPYEPGKSWWHNIGETVVVNPGQRLDAPSPNQVILDLVIGKAKWIATGFIKHS